MNIIRLILLSAIIANVNFATAAEAKSSCVVKAQDPVIQSFFRSKGFEVDDEKGNFEVEFEIDHEEVNKKKETVAHSFTTKLELFNVYEGKRVVYHTDSRTQTTGRIMASAIVPSVDNKSIKQELLEGALTYLKEGNINCDEEEEE